MNRHAFTVLLTYLSRIVTEEPYQGSVNKVLYCIVLYCIVLYFEAMELVCFSHIDKSFPVVRDLNGIVKEALACEQALLGPPPERPGELARRLKGPRPSSLVVCGMLNSHEIVFFIS